MPSSTMRCLNAGPPSCFFGFSGVLEWNQEHQHPPHTTLCFSISAASASHVSGEWFDEMFVHRSCLPLASDTGRGFSARQRLRGPCSTLRPELALCTGEQARKDGAGVARRLRTVTCATQRRPPFGGNESHDGRGIARQHSTE